MTSTMKGFFRASFWTAFTTGSRAVSMLIIAKVIAVEIGPDGLGKIGQFLSLITLLSVLAGGGVSTGLIRYIAEHRRSDKDIGRYIGAGLIISLYASLGVAVIGLCFSYPLAKWLLGTTNYVSLVWLLCAVQFFIAGNNLLLGIINGHSDTKRFAISSVLGLLVGLGATSLLTVKFGLYGALLGLLTLQSAPFFFSFTATTLAPWFKRSYFRPRVDQTAISDLSKYSGIAIATAIIGPVTQILARTIIEKHISWQAVGFWQAVTRLSDVFLLFVNMTLTTYYIPRLAQLTSPTERRSEVSFVLRAVTTMSVSIALGMYFLRSLIVPLLFSKDFGPVQELMGVELIGDVIKSASWTLAYLMLARAMTKAFVLTELAFACLNLILLSILLPLLGLKGAVAASAATAAIYFTTMAIVFRNEFDLKQIVGFRTQAVAVEPR